jgi:uncharacterized membrane protein
MSDDRPFPTSRPVARRVLVISLVLAALATVVGLVWLWPDSDLADKLPQNAFVAPGVTFEKARVVSVRPPCEESGPGAESGSGVAPEGVNADKVCGTIAVTLLTGDRRGERADIRVAPEVSASGLDAGDRLEVMQLPPSAGGGSPFSFFSVDRDTPLGWLAVIFVVVVALVARARGVLALVGLAFGGYVLVAFMLPALLDGKPGLGVAVVGGSTIMFVVLYLAHGLSIRTSAALAGTLIGVAITAIIGLLAIDQNRLSGISDETGAMLSGYVADLDFQGLLTCAVIIAGLGILNDVTITQSSSVWELRSAAPTLSRWQLFSSAMRIGRDHIASTIYTIVFAYAGAALSVLLLLYFYERPIMSLMSSEQIAEEIVRTLASGIGLVLAVPVTTAIAALTVADAGPQAELQGELQAEPLPTSGRDSDQGSSGAPRSGD